MAVVIKMAEWREAKGKVMQAAALLECPQCDHLTAAGNILVDGTTTYRCSGHGHRALTWRIDANGDMLRGTRGQRYY